MVIHKLSYGKHIINYEVHRKNVKNLNINLKPNLVIHVSAHNDVPEETVHKFVKKKAPWIIKNLQYFEKSLTDLSGDKEYVSGETFKYLGRQYRLKVIQSKDEGVKCQRGYFIIKVRNKKSTKHKEFLLKQWYQEKSNITFTDCLDNMLEKIQKYGVEKPSIRIRHMKARWGSCLEKSKIILLNSDLIVAPKFCIEYVILHELIHFKYRNHDRNFYKLQDALMPDWRKRKEILDMEIVKEL